MFLLFHRMFLLFPSIHETLGFKRFPKISYLSWDEFRVYFCSNWSLWVSLKMCEFLEWNMLSAPFWCTLSLTEIYIIVIPVHYIEIKKHFSYLFCFIFVAFVTYGTHSLGGIGILSFSLRHFSAIRSNYSISMKSSSHQRLWAKMSPLGWDSS